MNGPKHYVGKEKPLWDYNKSDVKFRHFPPRILSKEVSDNSMKSKIKRNTSKSQASLHPLSSSG